MKILVVGGTGFLGGTIVERALAAGHNVTTLTRGKTERPQSSNVKIIQANRYDSLAALNNQNYDFVFDTCAFTPDAVENLLNAVGNSIKRYVLISSISAYGDFSKPKLNEREPVPTAGETDYQAAKKCITEDNVGAFALGASYGLLKRACEIKAEEMLGKKTISLRLGCLVGAGDYTDRLTWWIRRIDQGGYLPAPLPKDQPIQIIDVRDAANFALQATTRQLSGIYNITSQPLQLSQFLKSAIKIIGANTELVWIDKKTIQEVGVKYWSELPLIVPPADNVRHVLNVDTSRAIEAGLSIRPLAQTLIPLLQWDRQRRNTPLKCGLPIKKEEQVLRLASA